MVTQLVYLLVVCYNRCYDTSLVMRRQGINRCGNVRTCIRLGKASRGPGSCVLIFTGARACSYVYYFALSKQLSLQLVFSLEWRGTNGSNQRAHRNLAYFFRHLAIWPFFYLFGYTSSSNWESLNDGRRGHRWERKRSESQAHEILRGTSRVFSPLLTNGISIIPPPIIREFL